jgi:hypothetical protein
MMGIFPSAPSLTVTKFRFYVGALGKMPIIDGSCGTHPNFFPRIPNEGDRVSGRRRRLLVCLLDVLTAGTDPVATRRAWRNYAICLLDIAHPHLNRKSLDKLEPIEFTLRLLVAREAGEVQPYEGILLVRDRNAP